MNTDISEETRMVILQNTYDKDSQDYIKFLFVEIFCCVFSIHPVDD